MTDQQYFEHLCATEAGEFIFGKVHDVEGFLFMRPPRRPTDDDLENRWSLEAPEIERTYQLITPRPQDRAVTFIDPPWAKYRFVEEPDGQPTSYLRMSGYRVRGHAMDVAKAAVPESRYGLTWRGIKHPFDREHGIAGSEWIVLDLATREVLAVQRNFARTGRTRNTPGGIWWLNASSCPSVGKSGNLPGRFYQFVSKVLVPRQE